MSGSIDAGACLHRHERLRRESIAAQTAAFFILSGIDLAQALATTGAARAAALLTVERLLERERLKGSRRHWSYDLNRHIALKQARDRLREPAAREEPPETTMAPVGRHRTSVV